MQIRVILTSLFFLVIAGHAFAQEEWAQDYVPDMTSPAILERVERFQEEHIDPSHSAEYREAVKKILLIQLNFIDSTGHPEKVIIKTKTENGETVVSLSRPGTGVADFSTESDDRWSKGAMTLRDKSVIALNWSADRADYEGASGSVSMQAYDSLVEILAKITTLEKLELGNLSLTDDGLKALDSMTQLKSLVFRKHGYEHDTLTYPALDSLHGLVNLEELVVDYGYHSAPEMDSTPLFQAVTHYPRLKKLYADRVELTPKNLRRLAQCRELEELALLGPMPEPCLEILASLPKLKKMMLGVSDCGQSFEFSRFPALEILGFGCSLLTTEKDGTPVITFTDLPELKSFEFYSARYDYHAVIYDLPKLQAFYVGRSRYVSFAFHSVLCRGKNYYLPGKAVVDIENLPALTEVDVRDFNRGTKFRIARTPKLDSLHLPSYNTPITLSLDVFPHSKMFGGDLAEDSEIPEEPNTLTALQWSQEGSSAILLNLLRLSPKVKDLWLIKAEITPEMWEAMAQMTELENLGLGACTLPEDIDFSQLKTLKKLNMGGSILPAEVGHLPDLTELTFINSTSPAEFSLVNMPALTRLNMYMSSGGQTLLVKDMPSLEYAEVGSGKSVVFEGCPSLKDGRFPYDAKRLDLRGTQIKKEDGCLRIFRNKQNVEILLD